MKEIHLYDSKTKEIKTLMPKEQGHVYIYCCGPTVYNHAHIGNARPIVLFDNLKRLLIACGYKVTYISNFTDVDDKIINEAIKENISEKEVTEKYIAAYQKVATDLNAFLPDFTPRVTNYMDKIIAFIDELVKKDYAYAINGDVYFRVSKVKSYGEISNRNIDDLLVGARIEENELKENPLDFCLWKKTEVGIKWDSPWSKGRPGWHTECVAMINGLTNNTYVDIHGGGMDLKFPHHENEQAQACAYCGHELAGLWIHNGMVNIGNEKMSKSLGNVIWAKDVIEKVGGQTTRWILNSTHYRAPINFSDEVIAQANSELNKIYTPLKQAALKLDISHKRSENRSNEYYEKYIDTLSDDLNIAGGITVIFDAVKQLNAAIRTANIDYEILSSLFNTINDMLYLIGMEKYEKVMTDEEITLYNTWVELKHNKEFEKADIIRMQLSQKGII